MDEKLKELEKALANLISRDYRCDFKLAGHMAEEILGLWEFRQFFDAYRELSAENERLTAELADWHSYEACRKKQVEVGCQPEPAPLPGESANCTEVARGEECPK